VVHPLLDSS